MKKIFLFITLTVCFFNHSAEQNKQVLQHIKITVKPTEPKQIYPEPIEAEVEREEENQVKLEDDKEHGEYLAVLNRFHKKIFNIKFLDLSSYSVIDKDGQLLYPKVLPKVQQNSFVFAVSSLPKKNFLVCVHKGIVYAWDLNNPRKKQILKTELNWKSDVEKYENIRATSLVIINDDNQKPFIFIGDSIGQITILDRFGGKILENMSIHDGAVNDIVCADNIIFTASSDKSIKLWQWKNCDDYSKHPLASLQSDENVVILKLGRNIQSENLLLFVYKQNKFVDIWEIFRDGNTVLKFKNLPFSDELDEPFLEKGQSSHKLSLWKI